MNQIVQVSDRQIKRSQIKRSQLKRKLLSYKLRQCLRQRDAGGLIDLIDILFRVPFHSGAQCSVDDIAQYDWRFDHDELWSRFVHGLQQPIYGAQLMTLGELESLASVVTYQTSQINSKLQAAVFGGQVSSIKGSNPGEAFFSAVGQRLPAIGLI